jgi:hypothetical protein
MPDSPSSLAATIKNFSVKAPVTARFEKELVRRGTSDIDRRWYATQKEHWLGWLGEYSGAGHYGRQNATTKATGEQVYNRIVNPAMLLWLVEASGTDKAIVEAAMKASLEAKTYAAQSAAIRRIAPWAAIMGRQAAGASAGRSSGT